MWIKCQDGTLVNTNQVSQITIADEEVLIAKGKSSFACIICDCSTKEEAEQLRDSIYKAINACEMAYSVLAEDQ